MFTGIRTWREAGYEGMAAFVVGDEAPLILIHEPSVADAEDDLVERVIEIGHADIGAAAAGRRESCLVGKVCEIRAGEAWRAAGEGIKIHAPCER